MKKFEFSLFLMVLAFSLMTANPLGAATLEVRPPGGIGTLGDVYTNIQQAIDDAGPGDTINVADGTYEEDLVIYVENLTLKSKNGPTVTTIKGVANVNEADFPLAVPNIEITADGVELFGFSIQGPDPQTGKYASGIVIGSDNVEIHDNIFQVTNASSLGEISQAIQTYRDGNGGAGDLDGLNIHDNNFAPWASGSHGYEAIFINHTPSDPSPAGTVTIQGNTISGAVVRGITTERSNVTITLNTVETTLDPFDGSVGAFQGILIQDFGARDQQDVTVTNNTVQGASGFSQGIRIGKADQVLANISVTNNTIQSNDIGVQVRASADGVVVNYNKIYDNTTYGAENTDAAVLDATLNWWGDLTGPYHTAINPDGLGNEVSDNIDFEPWYTSEDMLNPVVVYIDDTTDVRAYAESIQSGIDAAYPGDTIEVAAGTYNEYLHITKDYLTIEGAGIDNSIIDLDGLEPYWHYDCSGSYASRGGVLISGYGNPDEIVEGVTFTGFTVKNAGLNPPTTATGTHTDVNDAPILTDSTASWTPGALVGQYVHNYSDRDPDDYKPCRSYGQITANTATTITATLSGGQENDWDTGDEYVVTSYEHYYKGVDALGNGQERIAGIMLANSKNSLIEDCKAQNCGRSGIAATKARCVSSHKYNEGLTVNNCISQDNCADGIQVSQYSGPVTITNNNCLDNGVPHVADPTREWTGKGINLISDVDTVSGTIFNNTCSDNGFEGIVVRGGDGVIDDVNVENNTVTGHNSDEDGAGIFVYSSDWYGGYDKCQNVTVWNNTVTGNIRGVVLYNTRQITVEDNTITTDSGSFDLGQEAIRLDGGNNCTIIDNDISSCDGVGISAKTMWDGTESYDNTFTNNTIDGAKFAGVFIYSGAYDNTFTDNTITGTTMLTQWAGEDYEETQGDGVFLWGYTGAEAGTGNIFHCNKITGNADDGMENQTTTTVDAENNWWGDPSGPGGAGGGSGDTVSDYVDFFPWLLSPDCNDTTVTEADFVVDDDWAGLTMYTQVFVDSTAYYIGQNAFDVIQDAVDAATDGNSIKVADGNYAGAVVSEDLDIIGANPGGSAIKTGVHYGGGHPTATTAFRLDAGADGTEIRNFTIDCNRTDDFFFAVFARAVNDVVLDSLTVNQPVQGISNWGGSNWQITNNTLNETEAAGGGGIAILVGARVGYGTAQGNIIEDNVMTPAATAPTFTCPAICVSLDLRYGGYDDMTGTEDVSYNKVLRNYIEGNGAGSEVGVEIGVIGVSGDPNKIAATLGMVHDNLVRDNLIYSTDWGVYFYTVEDLDVIGNEIIDCNDAVHLHDSHKGVRVNYNNIIGNAVHGVNNVNDVTLDAEYNWWGDVSGPNDPAGTAETDGVICYETSDIKNADGTGNSVSDNNVDYCPWLTAPVSTSVYPYLRGDLDYDGDVDFDDVAILANNWLKGKQ